MAIYMKLSTIEGPLTQKGFEKQIELVSAGLGASRNIPQHTKNLQNRGVDEVEISIFNITKDWDGLSSGKMFESICKGTTDLTATISFTSQTDSGSLTYLTIDLANVGLANYSLHAQGGSGAHLPMESIGLSFTKIEVTPYTVASDKKPVKGGVVQFDLSTGVNG